MTLCQSNRMIRLLLSQCLALICFSFYSQAQDSTVDSLKSILLTQKEDTIKVNMLIELADKLYRSNPDEALEYGIQAKKFAENLDYTKGLAYASKNIGLDYYMLGNYVEASINWENSLAIMESMKDEVGAANLMSNLGATYSFMGDNAKAIEYFLRALSMAEIKGDSIRIATCLLNIGSVYSFIPETIDKAIPYYFRAFIISETINYYEAIGISAFNIGDYYLQKEAYDTALLYFEKSLEVNKNTLDEAPTLNNIGKVFAEKGDFQSAITYQEEALKKAENINGKLEMAQIYLGLATTYQKQGTIKQSINHFERAKTIAEDIESNNELRGAYEGLSNIYAGLSDYQKAYQFQTLLRETEKLIYNSETDDKIKNLQFTYQLDKKQNEIEILEQQSEIEQLKTKRQKVIKNASLGSLGFVVIIVFILYRNYRNKVKINKILDKQNAQIESLLLNILPEETAKELQQDGYATPRYYESVTVLFSDFVGFTKIAEGLKPHELIAELNSYFNAFDDIVEKYHLEKIKTIGDAYMCAGGVPTPDNSHPCRTVQAGLAMQEYMEAKNTQRIKVGKQPWELRVGIHTGPVVAGVVGNKKYAYDIWGDTVNIASRMESKGEPGKVNVSAATYTLINDNYTCQYRGKIAAKNKGNVDMYFIEKERSETHILF